MCRGPAFVDGRLNVADTMKFKRIHPAAHANGKKFFGSFFQKRTTS
jgi:hypothetical protein